MGVERGGCRQNNEVHDQVREEHSGDYVIAGLPQVRVGGSFPLLEGHMAFFALLLHFLGGLPEEQVGRNGGSEDSHERGPIFTRHFDMGDNRRAEHRGPIWLREEGGGDIGEQYQREPFEDSGDIGVGPPDQEGRDGHGVNRGPVHAPDSGHHLGYLRHAAEVGSNVDGVGGDQQRAGAPQDPLRILVADYAGQSLAGHHAEPRAHHLHGGHQRK